MFRLNIVVAVGCLLTVPASASAGQIVYHQEHPGTSDTFGVMNDDGSGQRTWLDVFADVPPSNGQRFVSGFDPEISEDGRRVAFTTQTAAFQDLSGPGAGANAQGVNVWQGGVVTRLSNPPFAMSGVSTFESKGKPVADGRIFFSDTEYFSSGGQPAGASGELLSFAADGSRLKFQADCDDTSLGIAGFDPDPVTPDLLAYAGCDEDGAHVITLARSGGPYTVAHRAPTSSGSTLAEPAWRPDGARLISTESDGQGSDELWTYEPDGSGEARLVTAPAGAQLSSPVWVGNDRVAFALASGDPSTSDIYTLPASCSNCTVADATRLTTDGSSSAPSWSAAGLVGEPKTPSEDPGPPGGSTGPSGSGGGSATPKLRAASARKVRRGLGIRVDLREAASVTVSVKGTKPKRRARKVTLRLRAGVNLVTLKTVAGRRLAKGTYRVSVRLDGTAEATSFAARVARAPGARH